MTDPRQPACHYDRALDRRVTRHHADDCPTRSGDPTDTRTCPGDRGCQPCTAEHCATCRREHTTHAHPLTCPTCIGKVRDDLRTIPPANTALAIEALAGGADGRLVAAAPIPGGTAQVLIGPTVRLDVVRIGRDMSKYHRPGDPIPAVAVLAQWEAMWRGYLGHDRTTRTERRAHPGAYPPPAPRPTVSSAVAYLTTQLDYMAQQTGPATPDFPAFARQIRDIRSQLEHALHDEQEPERGVECFECGDRLVRRYRDHARCTHPTPAREELRDWLLARETAVEQLRVFTTYPEAANPSWSELRNASRPPAGMIAAARRPCEDCAAAPGGIDDPDPGQSWECPGCRKEYSIEEYAFAVRRDLLENGADGDGWTHIAMAAEAATTLTGYLVPPGTVRKWIQREKVASKLDRNGVRLVFWHDVASESIAAVKRAQAAAAERRRRAELERLLWESVAAAKETPRAAGKRLGIPKARVVALCEQWSDEGRLDYKRSPDLGWAVAS